MKWLITILHCLEKLWKGYKDALRRDTRGPCRFEMSTSQCTNTKEKCVWKWTIDTVSYSGDFLTPSLCRDKEGRGKRKDLHLLCSSLWQLEYFSQYGDQATGWTTEVSWFASRQRRHILLFSQISRPALGPPTLLLNGYRDLKWPGSYNWPLSAI